MPGAKQIPSVLTPQRGAQKLALMKPDRLFKILLIGFGVALMIYILAFSFIQNRRTIKGPWHVMFSTDSEGTPNLLIQQTNFGIAKKIIFSEQKLEQKSLAQSFVFDDPTKTNAPFGQIIFQDLTFLPGTVTFNFFGHEVELLPRVLTIDKQEHRWKNGEVISVTGEGKFKPHPRQ